MKNQWDGRVFRCYYTGIPMTGGFPSRDYPTWEHRTPDDESSVVLVADLVNKMKVDMREDEFRAMVRALAAAFAGGEFDPSAFPRG